MRELILTSRFKRSLKKFVQRNHLLQQQVEKTLLQMEKDNFFYRVEVNYFKY